MGDTFHPTPVGVFFGEPGVEVDDPYFGGAGPRRRGCIECGQCMTGCRHGAKNTLLTNYLYLAEQAGAEVHPMTTVTTVRRDGERWAIDTRPHRATAPGRGDASPPTTSCSPPGPWAPRSCCTASATRVISRTSRPGSAS